MEQTANLDTPHLGSDKINPLSSGRFDVATGTRLHRADNPNELKLQRVANPAYYRPENAGALGPAYKTNPSNFGMWTTPTTTKRSGQGGFGVMADGFPDGAATPNWHISGAHVGPHWTG